MHLRSASIPVLSLSSSDLERTRVRLSLLRQNPLRAASRNSWQSNDAIPNLHLPFTDELRWLQMHASPMANGDVMVEHYLIRHERRAHRASAKA